MRDVNTTQQDRDLMDAGLQHMLKEAIAAVVQARGLPETRAAAERERDRVKELLDAIRDPSGAVLVFPRRLPAREA